MKATETIIGDGGTRFVESEILSCQGPPRCDYDGSGDVEARMASCVWCIRTIIDEDGREFATAPATA